MPSIKIGFDTRDLFFAQTGTRTFSEELLKEIKKDKSVELVELSPKKVVQPKNLFHKLLAHVEFIIWKTITLPTLAIRKNVDYLICPDYVAPFIFLGNTKTLPVFHGCNIWELPQNYNSVWRWYFSKLALLGESKAHQVLTVSEFSKRKLIQVLGIQKSKIKVLPIGSKSLKNTGQPSVQRPIHEEYLLHVGVLDKRKNLNRLIEAFAMLQDQTLKLVLVGGRPSKYFNDDYEEIINKIQVLKLEDRVYLKGYAPDEELENYYTHAKAYVFPSIYEGFGIPVLEAFLYGLPVAASNVASLPEVVGKGGLLFDPNMPSDMAEKIDKLLQLSPEELNQLRLEQKALLSWYNWKNTWEEIKKSIDER